MLAVVWIGLSLVWSLGLVPSLLLGAPLLVLLQLVRRKPMRTLWSRDTDSLARGWVWKLRQAACDECVVVLDVMMIIFQAAPRPHELGKRCDSVHPKANGEPALNGS